MKILASSCNTSWQIDGWKQWQTLFSWAPKSLQMVTAAMKLKGACSLGKKAMTNLDSILKSIWNCFTNKGSYSQSYGFSSCYVWIWVVAVQLLSGVWFLVIPWTAAYHASLSFTISQSLLKLILAQLNFSASSPEGSVLRQVVWFSSLRFQLWQMSCS